MDLTIGVRPTLKKKCIEQVQMDVLDFPITGPNRVMLDPKNGVGKAFTIEFLGRHSSELTDMGFAEHFPEVSFQSLSFPCGRRPTLPIRGDGSNPSG